MDRQALLARASVLRSIGASKDGGGVLARVGPVGTGAARPDLARPGQQAQAGRGHAVGDVWWQVTIQERGGVAQARADRFQHPIPLVGRELPHPHPDAWSMMDHSSESRFSTGVPPVRAMRAGVFSSRRCRAVRDSGFFASCASSAMMSPQWTSQGASVSPRIQVADLLAGVA